MSRSTLSACGPASTTVTAPTLYVVASSSVPFVVNSRVAFVPTFVKRAAFTTGTTCSICWVASRSPTTSITAVTALSGTTTTADDPSGATAIGRTTYSYGFASYGWTRKTTSVVMSNPTPSNVMAWPGFAAGSAGLADVPVVGINVETPVKLSPNETEVPPGVVTVIGPLLAFRGTVTLRLLPFV